MPLTPRSKERRARHRRRGRRPRPRAADGRDEALRAVQVALIKEIDAAIGRLERARIGESTREHLEILRSLLKAQVTAYLEHFVARRATLFSHTSVMYAGEVGAPGVLSTTFRGLLEGGTLTGGQGAKLAQLVERPPHAGRSSATAPPASPRCSTRSSSSSPWTTASSPSSAARTCPPSRSARSACASAWTTTPTSPRCSPRRGAWTPAGSSSARSTPRRSASSSACSPGTPASAAWRPCAPRRVRQAVDAIVAAFGGDAGYARELVAARPAGLRAHALGREGPAAPGRHLERRGPRGRRARAGRGGHGAPAASRAGRRGLTAAASPRRRSVPRNVTRRGRRVTLPVRPAAARYGLPAPVGAGRVPVHVAARRLVTPAPASEAGAAKTTGGDRDQQV